jgi:hypothetical protein
MTTPQDTDAAQFTARYADVKEQVDKLRDGLLNYGSSLPEHRQSLAAINGAVPEFFMDATLALANYTNNQAALVALMENEGEDARAAAFESGADVIGGALNDLGISLREAGDLQWHDHTPDA